jgi:hypothetical protein
MFLDDLTFLSEILYDTRINPTLKFQRVYCQKQNKIRNPHGQKFWRDNYIYKKIL